MEAGAAGKVVLFYIKSGRDADAESALNDLIANFSTQSNLPRILYDIAKQGYELGGNYVKAKELYEYITQTYPDSSYANESQLNIPKDAILALVDAGNDAGVISAVNDLIADYSGHSYLPAALARIAEQYYFLGTRAENPAQTVDKLQKAIAMSGRVMNDYAGAKGGADAYLYAAQSYEKLADYQNAVASYEKTAQDYPSHELIWHILFKTGDCYQELGKAGGISKEQAEAKAKAAYQQVVEKYPHCKAAPIAKRKLDELN